MTVTKEQVVAYLRSCVRSFAEFADDARCDKDPDGVAEAEEIVRQFAAAIVIVGGHGFAGVEGEEGESCEGDDS